MGYVAREDGFFPGLEELLRAVPDFRAERGEVLGALARPRLAPGDFAALLSPAAGAELEALARRAAGDTLRHFGRSVQLFAPLYLGNYCTNRCVYCGFHAGQAIRRRALAPEEIQAEAEALAATGLRRVLALTGDAPRKTGADYIADAVRILALYFPSVGIEVQALTEAEYALLCKAGADSMTMFQETYDPVLYETLHPAGPKRDFPFRLDAPHRAALGGMRGLTLGALLGLGDWRFDIFMLGMHALWLTRAFPHLELSLSLPRMRPVESAGAEGAESSARFVPLRVTDREFVQALTALRCFLPHVGITLSTRERARLRDKLLPLGVTRVSAGVLTSVGGYAAGGSEGAPLRKETARGSAVQFVIDDVRSVEEMAADLTRMGFQPVFADWLLPGAGDLPLTAGQCRSLGAAGEDVPRQGRIAHP